MLEQIVREHYQKLCVDPVAKKIFEYTQPWHITLLAGLTGILIIPALFLQNIFLAVILLIITGYLDTLDGTVARINKKTTAFGTVIDIVTDRIVEFSIILGLWLFDPSRSLMCILALGSITICVSSFLVVGIFSVNKSRKSFHYSPGIMERAEAFIFFLGMMLLPNYFNILSVFFILLVILTTFIRLIEFKSMTNKQPI